jgi:DNA-binding CsgD family transcriptional regulator
MHGPSSDAARFARGMNSVTNSNEVWRQLKALAAPFGFEHLTVLKRTSDLPRRIANAIVYIDAPQGFAAEFDREGFGPDHPLITRALQRLEPFSNAEETNATHLSMNQRRVLQRVSVSLNVRDGWTFPIARNGQLEGIVMLGGLKPDMSPMPCSVLHLASHTAFTRVQDLASGAAGRPHNLTNREVECLHWVAAGKTDLEIAVILSISARTARFHIENAKRKLRVATRVQAVAEALRVHAIAA